MTAAKTRQAIVDIGSNSVRLVIFEGPRRAPLPIVNEKALCGLGRDMTAEGIEPGAAAHALATLKRFRRLIAEHNDPPTKVFATAAVREARDGAAFIAAIREIGFDAVVIDGSEEATLAALGVVSYEPGASGLVGDLGGGSLELVALAAGEIGERASLSIGPLRLMTESQGTAGAAIERALDGVPWLIPGKFEQLYSVGGAWRAIARIHMRLKSYPLSVLHHYELTRADAVDICMLVARQSRRSLEETPGITRRRVDTLPLAALTLKAVLDRARPARIIVSAGGAREGLLYRDLSPAERALDPLVEGARFFAARLAPDPDVGEAVVGLTDPLFPDEPEAVRRLRVATAILGDVAAYFHPDLRADQAFETAIRAPFYGVTHRERIAIALSLHCRHDGRAAGRPDERIIGLLSPEERERAIRLGLAMRFAAALSPKAARALRGTSLGMENGTLVFRAPRGVEALMGELPRKRLEALGEAFGRPVAEAWT